MKRHLLLLLFAFCSIALYAQKKVYVIAGEKNAGRYTTTQLGIADSVKCWNYFTKNFEDSVDVTRQLFGRKGGVIVQLAEALQDKYPTDTLYFIQYHRPDTDLGRQWNVENGILFPRLCAEIDAALDSIGDYDEINFIWMQGEKDARHSSFATAYRANEYAMLDSLNDRYDLDVIVNMNLPTHNPYQYKATVRTAKTVNDSISNVVLINPSALRYSYDKVHLTFTVGMTGLAELIADEL